MGHPGLIPAPVFMVWTKSEIGWLGSVNLLLFFRSPSPISDSGYGTMDGGKKGGVASLALGFDRYQPGPALMLETNCTPRCQSNRHEIEA